MNYNTRSFIILFIKLNNCSYRLCEMKIMSFEATWVGLCSTVFLWGWFLNVYKPNFFLRYLGTKMFYDRQLLLFVKFNMLHISTSPQNIGSAKINYVVKFCYIFTHKMNNFCYNPVSIYFSVQRFNESYLNWHGNDTRK